MFNIFTNIQRLWKRQTRFFIVNILGLSIGLSVSILLILFVFNEVSYDRYFSKKDHIIRLYSIWNEDGNESFMPLCLRSAFTELPSKVPGVENALQIYRGWGVEITFSQNTFKDLQLLYADTSFFSFFNLKAVYGNPSLALKSPNTAILTRTTAQQIFGIHNPVGKTFTLDGELYTLGAVIEDIPENTHFKFDILSPMSSLSSVLNRMDGLEFFTYYLLNPRMDRHKVISQINSVYKSYLDVRFAEFNSTFNSEIENLTDLHLYSRTNMDLSKPGSIKMVLFLAILSLLILILAITNFINLFLVQGESRSSEIGVRKVNGAANRSIIIQFFSEAASLVILSFIVGFALIGVILPEFTKLIGHTIETSILYSPQFISCILLLIAVVIFLSGFYPAIYLGKLNPVKIIGRTSSRSFRKQKLITAVVIFQSVITIFLISLVLIMGKQINLLKSMPLGYSPENVMVVHYPSNLIKSQYAALKDKLISLPEVENVGAGQHIIGAGMSGQGLYKYGSSPDNKMAVNEYRIIPGTCESFGLQLNQGRFFRESDKNSRSIILNETAIQKLELKDPIGEKVVMFDYPMEIIGVVKDFYYESTARVIQPLALTYYRENFNFIFIKFGNDVEKSAALTLASKTFSDIDKEHVINATWSDEMNSGKYYREDLLSVTIKWGTIISMIIALLGMYAIHSYQILQRTKEIGVRRVMGSRISDILMLTASKSIKWIFVAGLVGLPVSYYVSMLWLQNYVNRIQPDFLVFMIPVVVQMFLALIITSGESWRTIRKSPVESLRYE